MCLLDMRILRYASDHHLYIRCIRWSHILSSLLRIRQRHSGLLHRRAYLCIVSTSHYQYCIPNSLFPVGLFPELEGWFESLFLPYVRTLVCAVISFLPFSIYLNMVDWEPDALPAWFFMIVGVIYFPGIFMRTALLDSFDGLSPSGWWDLVKKAPMTYLGLVFSVLAGVVIVLYLPSGVWMTFLTLSVILYMICVLMNVFGLFLLKHEFAEDEDDDGFSVSSAD